MLKERTRSEEEIKEGNESEYGELIRHICCAGVGVGRLDEKRFVF